MQTANIAGIQFLFSYMLVYCVYPPTIREREKGTGLKIPLCNYTYQKKIRDQDAFCCKWLLDSPRCKRSKGKDSNNLTSKIRRKIKHSSESLMHIFFLKKSVSTGLVIMFNDHKFEKF
uniref:Uncharacterized protein n=1 Tax=Arundo donax TaxID=35708 RepID=A0A0A9CWY5_ARUDO